MELFLLVLLIVFGLVNYEIRLRRHARKIAELEKKLGFMTETPKNVLR